MLSTCVVPMSLVSSSHTGQDHTRSRFPWDVLGMHQKLGQVFLRMEIFSSGCFGCCWSTLCSCPHCCCPAVPFPSCSHSQSSHSHGSIPILLPFPLFPFSSCSPPRCHHILAPVSVTFPSCPHCHGIPIPSVLPPLLHNDPSPAVCSSWLDTAPSQLDTVPSMPGSNSSIQPVPTSQISIIPSYPYIPDIHCSILSLHPIPDIHHSILTIHPFQISITPSWSSIHPSQISITPSHPSHPRYPSFHPGHPSHPSHPLLHPICILCYSHCPSLPVGHGSSQQPGSWITHSHTTTVIQGLAQFWKFCPLQQKRLGISPPW